MRRSKKRRRKRRRRQGPIIDHGDLRRRSLTPQPGMSIDSSSCSVLRSLSICYGMQMQTILCPAFGAGKYVRQYTYNCHFRNAAHVRTLLHLLAYIERQPLRRGVECALFSRSRHHAELRANTHTELHTHKHAHTHRLSCGLIQIYVRKLPPPSLVNRCRRRLFARTVTAWRYVVRVITT